MKVPAKSVLGVVGGVVDRAEEDVSFCFSKSAAGQLATPTRPIRTSATRLLQTHENTRRDRAQGRSETTRVLDHLVIGGEQIVSFA
jgi:hypothetical protein